MFKDTRNGADTMKTKTETISTDPLKFAATVTVSSHDGTITYTYVGDEGESRAVVKRKAVAGMQSKINRLYNTRN